MPTGSFLRNPKLRSGLGLGLTALTVLGITIAGTGTASANDIWNVQIINNNVPSGTGSVRVTANGASACTQLNHSSNTTTTGFTPNAPTTITVESYGDTRCSGARLGSGISYSFNRDDDVHENNLNCGYVALGAARPQHAFRICH
ncbi:MULTISPECIES: hypothetical protein [unclassified Streptomyces]|uniref:hypothetical protein n=1 Tax=unclassified Streptomyces TaxID=2593676 RepID=UPI0037FA1A0F